MMRFLYPSVGEEDMHMAVVILNSRRLGVSSAVVFFLNTTVNSICSV